MKILKYNIDDIRNERISKIKEASKTQRMFCVFGYRIVECTLFTQEDDCFRTSTGYLFHNMEIFHTWEEARDYQRKRNNLWGDMELAALSR